jgi:hypothetical protein
MAEGGSNVEVFTPIAWLDYALVALFTAECCWIVAMFQSEIDNLGLFALCLGIVHVFITSVKSISVSIGGKLCDLILAKGLVKQKESPLKGEVQMTKWREQSWQLVIHVVMTVFELIVLAGDPDWWYNTETCWIPEPDAQYATIKMSLKFLYILQLVGSDCFWMPNVCRLTPYFLPLPSRRLFGCTSASFMYLLMNAAKTTL